MKTALRLFLWMTVLTGFLYPLLITFIALLIHPNIDLYLIGQNFESDSHFWGRPGGNTQLGPTSKKLQGLVNERKERMLKTHPESEKIPVELLFGSASGLDPHISPETARFQIKRIAAKRNISEEELEKLIKKKTKSRTFGFLGTPVVNVLELNEGLHNERS